MWNEIGRGCLELQILQPGELLHLLHQPGHLVPGEEGGEQADLLEPGDCQRQQLAVHPGHVDAGQVQLAQLGPAQVGRQQGGHLAAGQPGLPQVDLVNIDHSPGQC